MKIAVSGKGGAGKTTLAAGLSLAFAGSGCPVYAVDADPDANLGLALGFSEESLLNLRPLVELEGVIRERVGEGAFFRVGPEVDDLLDAYSARQGDIGDIRLLRMGAVKKAGTACYCRENAFLSSLMNSLLLKRREVAILDMSAGIEHLTRGTARGVDIMLIVVEPTAASLRTGRIVERLALDLGIARTAFVANKIKGAEDLKTIRDHIDPGGGGGDNRLLGVLPFDDDVRRGEPVASVARDSRLFSEFQRILERVKAGSGARVGAGSEDRDGKGKKG
ncbi:MAG: AAA family ATPase [Firmicutes bacterium]|nr:AAA family ATPase [Bacillota bacterium]